MKNYILYQAYGNLDNINECKYALLRLLDVYKSYNEIPEVIIYTDKPEEFSIFQKDLPLIFEVINNDDISKWRGSIKFVHRVKVEIIKNCLKKYPGKIIYCDTDTYCNSDLSSIFNSLSAPEVFFHRMEGSISELSVSQVKKWKKLLGFAGFSNLSPLKVNMWNAGVIALENAHLPLLDKVLELTDNLYPILAKHTIEQFSFCYVFQKENIHISAAEPLIFHYWQLKEFRILLKSFFAKYKTEDINTLVNLSKNILPETMVKDKLEFKRSGIASKFIKRISGKKWSIDNYKYLLF